jgi:FkbM family methyltransferase
LASILPTLRYIASHPLSSKQPLQAILRYGRWQIESRLRHQVEFAWIGGSKHVARNGMAGVTGNIYCGLHEFADMAFLLHLLRPKDLFVDVGANIGSYTILASAVCGAQSIAAEPDPDTMLWLKKNVAANRIEAIVVLIDAAIGSRSGSLQFTRGKDAVNSVATESDPNTRMVQVRTLDELLASQNPVLLKIDVEGYEPEVIAGSIVTLTNPSLLAVQLETVDKRIRARLADAGFVQASYDPFTRKLSPGINQQSELRTSNSLFVRDLDQCRHRVATAVARNVLGQQI